MLCTAPKKYTVVDSEGTIRPGCCVDMWVTIYINYDREDFIFADQSYPTNMWARGKPELIFFAKIILLWHEFWLLKVFTCLYDEKRQSMCYFLTKMSLF